MKNLKYYLLTGSLLTTTAMFSIAGYYYKLNQSAESFSAQSLPFVYTMDAIHDGSFLEPFTSNTSVTVNAQTKTSRSLQDEITVKSNLTKETTGKAHDSQRPLPSENKPLIQQPTAQAAIIPNSDYAYDNHVFKECLTRKAALLDDIGITDSVKVINGFLPTQNTLPDDSYYLTQSDVHALQILRHGSTTYDFTTVNDQYFEDAVFIGDSRTVGIEQYAGIENATFLCKTSLTIYDYDKKKISYENQKTSIRDVLAKKQFQKVYLMVGINECSYGTTDSYAKEYSDVVNDIRELQPNALIFIQGNLDVTSSKSNTDKGINNNNINQRNEAIKALANQHDIFYIDINESPLCEDGALISEYTWDQVHIKAQYYPIWKDFYLAHGIVTK